ncbi:MAG TPA: ATP-binding protein [Solirubrobacteraceae bacterium]|nr:ATP-binding protein [Solirubrobacteraceae bacterium]
MRRRAIENRYRETVATRRVTVVTGPRQSGKTTLVRSQLGEGALRSLDDAGVLAAALEDPVGFLATAGRPLVIDEVQRAGEPLVRAIKAQVDRDPTPGQFVLTGSSNFLTVPTISESLAGRAGFVEVRPFTEGELAGRTDGFIDAIFAGVPQVAGYQPSGLPRDELLERVCTGGYPEVHALPASQRSSWFRDYVRTTIQRDVVEMSGIRKVAELGQLLRLIAARSGCELVMQGLIDDSALERQAVYDHRAWLQTIHLVETLPAWSRNLTSRAKKRPKVFVTDPGLTAWLVGKTPSALADPTDPATGRLVETFVFAELRRQLTWATTEAGLFHWQNVKGGEVDFVLESSDGRVAAIEVKAGQTPKRDWFGWLAYLRDALGHRFVGGVVLYGGQNVLSFGDRLLAAPISALWEL